MKVEPNTWNQIQRRIKDRWNKLSDADLVAVGGMRENLVAKVQSVYGLRREDADREVRDFERGIDSDAERAATDRAGASSVAGEEMVEE